MIYRGKDAYKRQTIQITEENSRIMYEVILHDYC